MLIQNDSRILITQTTIARSLVYIYFVIFSSVRRATMADGVETDNFGEINMIIGHSPQTNVSDPGSLA